MAVSQQLRDRAISDVYLTRWEIGDETWGVVIEFDGGSYIMEKAGTRAQAQQRVLDILRDADRVLE